MKKITNKLVGIAFIGVAYLAASCESREQLSYGGTNPLSSPTVTVAEIGYKTLTFKWNEVSNAIEYGYTLTNANGKVVDGGTTRVDSVKFEDLDLCTEYTFHLYAYAAVKSENTTSQEITATASTVFYPFVNVTGTYTSVFVTSNTWKPTLTEVRAEGKENEFGIFTLSSWYNHAGYDLQFSVNSDNTIKVLNGTLDEATGFVKVLAGPSTIKTNAQVRNGALIDEANSTFDIENQTLTLFVRSTKDASKEGEDVFEWE